MTSIRLVLSDLNELLMQYRIEGTVSAIVPFGTGHINDTFHVKNANTECPDYLLQRINNDVFKNVPALTHNIRLVTSHLKSKLAEIPGANPDKEVLTLLPTKAGKYYVQDKNGNSWRLHYFLKGTKTYDIVTTKKQAMEGGKAFGKFLALLSDIESSKLYEVIPDFHNIKTRLAQLDEAIANNIAGRKEEVLSQMDFVNARRNEMQTLLELGKAGKIPTRVTHNDTKFNNILLNSNDKAQCVIDLDTVMPGFVAYDFGDAIRTIINKAAEDEPDTDKIQLNIPLFEAFTNGFLAETGCFLTEIEISSLINGVLLLPFIMGVRFLTDHLNGDVYYKLAFAGHNLQRTRAQFVLVNKIELNVRELNEIIMSVYDIKTV
jgi:hypothetical protein